jgi:hypothetical protein
MIWRIGWRGPRASTRRSSRASRQHCGRPDARAQETERKAAKKLKLQVERLEATVKSQAQTIHEFAVERENEKPPSEKLHAKADALRSPPCLKSSRTLTRIERNCSRYVSLT